MTAAKHTPGPWGMEVRHDGNIDVGPVEPQAPAHVNGLATVYGDDAERECWPVTANAKLIAAAPTMAEAIERTLGCETPGAECGCEEALRAALRAAGRLP